MDRFRLLLSSLALSGLAASASAQQFDIFINTNSNWVLNTSSGENDSLSANDIGGPNCQSQDLQVARVDWDTLHGGTFGFGGSTARYAGSLHSGCELDLRSASASKTGHASFVHSPGTGSFDIDIFTNPNHRTTTPQADASGQVEAVLTVTLDGSSATCPPGALPPYHKEVSSSASVTGTGSLTFTDFAVDKVKTCRTSFSVSVLVEAFSSINIPPPSGPIIKNDLVFALLSINSEIRLGL